MKLSENISSNIINQNSNFHGVALTGVVGFIAFIIGNNFPLVGGAVSAIILGVLLKNFIGVPKQYVQGIQYTLKKLLKVAIVLLGFGLSFHSILQTGLHSLLIIFVAVISGFTLTFFIAKLMGLKGNIPLLIGAGTGICGATAIATTGPILQAKQEDIAYAINTIFAFNVLAVLIYPLIGQLLSLSELQFGIWAGSAIHDTSSVVAAGYMFGNESGDTSVVIKLIRTLMLIPFALAFAFYVSYRSAKSDLSQKNFTKAAIKAFPSFILLFVLAVFLNSWLQFPTAMTDTTNFVAKFLIFMVMASVGLETNLKKIKSVGIKPLIVGLFSSIIMGSISLALIFLFY
ncbi:YeiH family protein [Sutcliffiella cohnii]|uniref:YeiH family protein n=1 Tax=Sutcliffiella cohnii TaxID=33932 RepID=UPI002E1CDD6E|nr:YeiH family protein [Sutcliffiella cohnii]